MAILSSARSRRLCSPFSIRVEVFSRVSKRSSTVSKRLSTLSNCFLVEIAKFSTTSVKALIFVPTLFDKASIFFSIVVRVGRFEDIKKVYQSMQSPQMSGNMLQCTDNAVDKQKRYSDYRADNKRYQ